MRKFLRLLLATGNPDKVSEIEKILDVPEIELLSLSEMGIELPPETGLTLFENALIKARHGFAASGLPTAAEDTGLFVDALGGMPGVFSSRFAGPGASYADNRQKLTAALRDFPFERRRARFVAVVAFTADGESFRRFDGVVEGFITRHDQGQGGFGYDPVFLYPPMGRTFAEIPRELKNRISHRAKAFAQLKEFLLESRIP